MTGFAFAYAVMHGLWRSATEKSGCTTNSGNGGSQGGGTTGGDNGGGTSGGGDNGGGDGGTDMN